ncbi:ONEC2 protein, partial [Loxia curvirostra]|nr:ONEC2 protein [Loxia curvirostra]
RPAMVPSMASLLDGAAEYRPELSIPLHHAMSVPCEASPPGMGMSGTYTTLTPLQPLPPISASSDKFHHPHAHPHAHHHHHHHQRLPGSAGGGFALMRDERGLPAVNSLYGPYKEVPASALPGSPCPCLAAAEAAERRVPARGHRAAPGHGGGFGRAGPPSGRGSRGSGASPLPSLAAAGRFRESPRGPHGQSLNFCGLSRALRRLFTLLMIKHFVPKHHRRFICAELSDPRSVPRPVSTTESGGEGRGQGRREGRRRAGAGARQDRGVPLGRARRAVACKRKEQEPNKERNNSQKKSRLVFTDLQRRTLFAIFKENKRPSKEMQITISQQLGLELNTVSNFFMNARRRSLEKWQDDLSSGGSSSAPSTCTKA